MAKVVPTTFLDNGLNYDTTLNQVVVCNAQPTSYADIDNVKLAVGTLGTVTLSGSSSRQSNLPAVSGITIDSTGTANHIAYRDTTNSRYYVTTCTSTSLTAGGGNTVSVGSNTRTIGAVT